MNNKAVAAIVACFLFFQVILKFSRIPKVAEILKGSEKTKQQLNCKASEMSASMRFGCFTTVKFVLFLLLLIFLDISNCRHCHLPPTGFSGLSPRHALLLQLLLYPFIDNDTLTAKYFNKIQNYSRRDTPLRYQMSTSYKSARAILYTCEKIHVALTQG